MVPAPLLEKQARSQVCQGMWQVPPLPPGFCPSVGDVATLLEGTPIRIPVERKRKSTDSAPVSVRRRKIRFFEFSVRYFSHVLAVEDLTYNSELAFFYWIVSWATPEYQGRAERARFRCSAQPGKNPVQ
ncbi:hypothetical protein D6833_13440 [Candidatus Parcubacteria bacterium]|nr:MAG: hypothetical protein D6833_13440 [Candidatus Parcubacteria bacterium]